MSLAEALNLTNTTDGASLGELSRRGPVLAVFLRHLGCTFCREMLADVSRLRPEIEAAGRQIVLVHMSPDADAKALFSRYGLEDVPRISDPDKSLYRQFGLQSGSLLQVVGPKAFVRGLGAVLRHGLGRPRGDVTQLAGLFLLRDGQVVREFRHRTSADKPDYRAFLNG